MTTWNPADTAGPISLSNGNLTATATSTAGQGVRSTTSRSAGKVYLEFTMPGMVANTTGATVGIANASEILNTSAQLGASPNSMGFYPSNPAQATYVNGISLNAIVANVSGTVTVGMAIDFTTTPPTLYVTDQAMQGAGLPWNNLASANPATSTQGISLTGLTGAPYFAAYNDFGDSPGIACTANFGAKAFAYPVPAGYTAWDGTADWIQPPGPPPRRARARQQSNLAFLPVVAAGEIVTIDKWFQPAAQPRLQRRPQQPPGPAPNIVSLSATSAYRRASAATYFNPAGILTAADVNEIRYNFDPATLAPLGILIEPARTNSVTNPRAEGAVPGTPGTGPTGWGLPAVAGALTSISVIGSGTESGIGYVDVAFTTNGSGAFECTFGNTAGNLGQVWTGSAYLSLVGGSNTNVTHSIVLYETGGTLASNSTPLVPTGAGLATQYYSVTHTNTSVGTSGNTFRYHFGATGAASWTMRLGGPQLERGSAATSLILPPVGSPGVSNRAADLPFPEVITSDKWFQPASQPVPRTQMRQPGGAIGTFLQSTPEIVTADKWLQPTSQPIGRRGAQQISPVFVPVVVSAENVTLDKWLQPSSQPVRRVPIYAAFVAGPLLQTALLSPTQRRALVSWLD